MFNYLSFSLPFLSYIALVLTHGRQQTVPCVAYVYVFEGKILCHSVKL